MKAETETFLAVSRAYLFAPMAHDACGASADLVARATPQVARTTRGETRRGAGLMPRCASAGEAAGRVEPW